MKFSLQQVSHVNENKQTKKTKQNKKKAPTYKVKVRNPDMQSMGAGLIINGHWVFAVKCFMYRTTFFLQCGKINKKKLKTRGPLALTICLITLTDAVSTL